MTVVAMYGCLEVERQSRGYVVSYLGQMQTTELSIQACFESLYGSGAWDKLKLIAVNWNLDGLDYAWSVKVPRRAFEKAFEVK